MGSVNIKHCIAVIGALVTAALLVVIYFQRAEIRDQRDALAQHCELTRAMAGNPEMKCKDALVQQQKLVVTLVQMRDVLPKITEAARQRRLALTTAREQIAAEQQRTAGARNEAGRAVVALEASARAPRASCEPSEEIKRRWK